MTGRVSTTERTAVEQALLSQSAERTIDDFPQELEGNGRSFYLITDEFDRPDEAFILSELRHYLLSNGFHEVRCFSEKENLDECIKSADIIVEPRAATAAIDDSELLIGIPEWELNLGLVGTSTPEFALYKKTTQRGRNRMAIHGTDRETGELIFDIPFAHSETYYIRQKLFFIFAWRMTNLEGPF